MCCQTLTSHQSKRIPAKPNTCTCTNKHTHTHTLLHTHCCTATPRPSHSHTTLEDTATRPDNSWPHTHDMMLHVIGLFEYLAVQGSVQILLITVDGTRQSCWQQRQCTRAGKASHAAACQTAAAWPSFSKTRPGSCGSSHDAHLSVLQTASIPAQYHPVPRIPVAGKGRKRL